MSSCVLWPPPPPAEQGAFERALAAVRAHVPGRAFAAAWEDGRALEQREAVAMALAASVADPTAELTSAECGPLSAREREVAEAIARGLTNEGIAVALVISRRTVERHVENIFAKLGVASRAQIATWATRTSLSSS
jgi:non-specific serine/threonine protein kinase